MQIKNVFYQKYSRKPSDLLLWCARDTTRNQPTAEIVSAWSRYGLGIVGLITHESPTMVSVEFRQRFDRLTIITQESPKNHPRIT